MKYGVVKNGKVLFKYGFLEDQKPQHGCLILPVVEAKGKGRSEWKVIDGQIVETIIEIPETEEEKKLKKEKKKHKKKDKLRSLLRDSKLSLEDLVLHLLGCGNIDKAEVDELKDRVAEAVAMKD